MTKTRLRGLAAICSPPRTEFGSDAHRLRPGGTDDDVLERLHLLAHAVLEQLEVFGPQIRDGYAIARRVDVDTDVVRLGRESRRRLRLR